MATLKLTIVPAKILKNGNHKIRVALGHKQETRYLVTRFEVPEVGNLKDGQIINTPDAAITNTKLRNLLNEYQEALDKITPDSFSCSQLRDYLSKKSISEITFLSYSNSLIKEMYSDDRVGSAKLYEYAVKYFSAFVGSDVPFNYFTPTTIKDFEKFLKNVGLNITTRGMYHARIKHIINAAIQSKYVAYEDHPYTYYIKPDSEARELDITVDELKLIRDYSGKAKTMRVARDLFMLSYYLGGINLIDLLGINFKENTETIEYVRTKSEHTKKGDKRISITIPDEAKPIISEWIGRNGKLDFGYSYSYSNLRNYITGNIRNLATELGIKKRVVYYSARKSFVQHGYELGIPLETLEYTIGQTMKKNRPIFSYVKMMRKHADEAIRKILDSIK